MKMAKLILLKGLPASGKSTWAKEYMQTHPHTKRVNKDDLRAMIDDSVWNGDNEKFILQVRDNIVIEALKKGFDVIVDDTNLSPKHERRLKAITPNNTEFLINDSFLDVSLADCILRDKGREKPVGEKVIKNMHRQFLSSRTMTREEKSDLWFQTFTDKRIEYIPYNIDLPDAIIVDIDGTIALHDGRSPFDYSKVLTDQPNGPVIDVVKDYSQKELVDAVIVVSGREGSEQVRLDTITWLSRHHIPYAYLYMREEGDYRKDVEIKKEIYETFIKGEYNILFVLDDRDQTVKGWRDLGLPCFQVAEGNF